MSCDNCNHKCQQRPPAAPPEPEKHAVGYLLIAALIVAIVAISGKGAWG